MKAARQTGRIKKLIGFSRKVKLGVICIAVKLNVV